MKPYIVDNFLMRPELERERALKASYERVEHNGLDYRGISLCKDERNFHRIERILGVKFKETICYYRRNLSDEENETYIHSDVLIGTFTSILYLNPECPEGHGTAFWRHKEFGFDHHEPKEHRDDAFWKKIYTDGFDESKWDRTDFVEMNFNRLIIFSSPQYHSRFPMQSFGSYLGDARLIKVFFGKV